MIARVFPRRTIQTPRDELVFIGEPPLFVPAIDEVHISVTFTWDLPEAERIARAWEKIAPVKIGGPATGMAGSDFTPGKYIKRGVVITSRGCPNRCPFCFVWRRDGATRELPITDGWIVQDDNLLACSREHFDAVISMLGRQPEKAQFTGGLEARRLRLSHTEALYSIRPAQIFFALDNMNNLEALRYAVDLCKKAGFKTHPSSHVLRAYVLIGYKGDTFAKAESRLNAVKSLGLTPMAMLYRDESGKYDLSWRRFQRSWARPCAIWAVNA